MKIHDIKKLAKHTIVDGAVNKAVAQYVTSNLTRSDIKNYVFYLKKEIQQRTVYITSAEELQESQKKKFAEMFVHKDAVFTTDKNLGAGIVIKTNDTIMDASLKGLIDTTINELKN